MIGYSDCRYGEKSIGSDRSISSGNYGGEMGRDGQKWTKMVKRWTKGGQKVDKRWSKGGQEVDKRWPKGGQKVVKRWSKVR